ncbi:MAG TPA: hypothetical protein VHB98_10055 [Chloroflexota bacterium]|jgi:hypothetical protein|nr:hypothetical protein [Chloroflexota bacterium]
MRAFTGLTPERSGARTRFVGAALRSLIGPLDTMGLEVGEMPLT